MKRLKSSVDGRLMHMRFCKSLLFVLMGLVGLGCATAADAQAGVYVGYTATRLSGITCLTSVVEPASGVIAPLQCSSGANGQVVNSSGTVVTAAQNGVVNPAGIQAGAYYDFKTVGPVRLGLDLRGGDFHSNKSAASAAGGKNATGLDYVLLGVRGSFHTRYSWLSPYVQASAGYARSNATLPFGTSVSQGSSSIPQRSEDNFLMYEGFAGIDIHVFPAIDLRPVEVGIGNMNRFGNSGAGDGPSSVGVKSIGAAVVFHMPTSH
jgi:hypothetical protein